MLTIYSDKRYVPHNVPYVAMLYPFWGGISENPLDPDAGRYDKYTESGNSMFTMGTLEQSAVAVLPLDWSVIRTSQHTIDEANHFIGQATLHHKPTAVFYWNDDTGRILLPNSIVLRTSVSGASTRMENEFAHPSWYEDPIEKYHNSILNIRRKSSKPTVGFCGFCTEPEVKSVAKRVLKRVILRRKVPVPGHDLRWYAIRALQMSGAVDTNFILRDQFYGGAAAKSDGAWDVELKRRVRAEYVDNVLGSDYTLCLRGTGNYCHRLYETLCCGRIPVFVNTDCVLPYDFIADWKQHCVWVEESELNRLPEIVAAFHDSLSPKEFLDLQYACRRFWEKWLSPEGFFRNIHLHLEKLQHDLV